MNTRMKVNSIIVESTIFFVSQQLSLFLLFDAEFMYATSHHPILQSTAKLSLSQLTRYSVS